MSREEKAAKLARKARKLAMKVDWMMAFQLAFISVGSDELLKIHEAVQTLNQIARRAMEIAA